MDQHARRAETEAAVNGERGFTLVEMLIVVVLLGVLAVIAVFAVRGITDRGQENAEATDLRTLQTGIEAYRLEHDVHPSEDDLVTAGLLREPSDLYDIRLGSDDSYEIVNVRTGVTVAGEIIATPPGEDDDDEETPPAENYNGWHGASTTNAGLHAVRYGDGVQVEEQIGGATMRSDWNEMVSDGAPTPNGRTYVLIDVDQITTAEIARAVASATVGEYDFDVYTADDPNIPIVEDGVEYACVYDFWRYAPGIARRPDHIGGTSIR